MGFQTRLPDSNDKPPVLVKQWMPEDEVGALLRRSAVRCCGCHLPVLASHVTIDDRGRAIKDKHAFCPDCKDKKECLCSDNFDRHYNVTEFIEQQARKKK